MKAASEYPAKFATAEECVAELRDRATRCAGRYLASLILFDEGKARKIDVARNDERLNAWCTAVEALTANGNYYAERSIALDRARREAAK